MFQEFKTFISRGNVMDMAVGIIVGAAFTAIVSSLVADLVNPIISLFLGGLDFSGLFIVLGGGQYDSLATAEEAGAAVFAYGRFIMAVLNFLIIAFVVFLLVKGVNSLKHKEEDAPEPAPAPAPGPTEIDLLTEIRDALRK